MSTAQLSSFSRLLLTFTSDIGWSSSESNVDHSQVFSTPSSSPVLQDGTQVRAFIRWWQIHCCARGVHALLKHARHHA